MESDNRENILFNKILRHLPFEPIEGQYDLIEALCRFVDSADPYSVFIINGYAGTGKTSVTGAFVRALKEYGINTVLLSPTGRGAKIFSSMAGKEAFTIHKRIFRGDQLDSSIHFFRTPNKDSNTLFIIDEASMIGDSYDGSSSLLAQLISHVYNGKGCRAIFIGDSAQLPPVGQIFSPAIDSARMREFGLNPSTISLNVPVRQVHDSGILYNATLIRNQIIKRNTSLRPLRASGFSDVTVLSPADLEDAITTSWSNVGREETIVITRSNFRANLINSDIRNRILYADSELLRGERIVVTKNNYFWKPDDTDSSGFIANGETLSVIWYGRSKKIYGHKFTEAELTVHGNDKPFAANILLDSLNCEGPCLSNEEMKGFLNTVIENANGSFSEKLSYARKDPYFNALQVKYAYCLTCHKAQGGQWKHVYLDLGGLPTDNLGEDYLRWLYTAVTRASEHLFLINPSIPVI